ncbi:MAG: prolyl oligopeptidase family serine peptidase [Proteobacteria bacterium]|nr:prolyl oligopeptidase family serine peptidase [Pseudomonadota bacterium]
MSMFTQHVFRIAIVLVAAAFANAWAGPYEPAVHITELTDESRARTMEVWIWGPAERTGNASLVAGNSVFEPVAGRTGRDFAPGAHPLLVFFHGTSGNTRSIAWLSSALAAHGYAVVSANHPGSTSLQVSQESLMQTWQQAEDGSFLIDTLLASKEFAASIDAERIGSIGFSLGGYSALAIAGVRLEIRKLQAFCRARPEEETCKLFPDALYGAEVEGRPQNRDVSDPRIRAAVSLAPGFVPALDPDSVAAVGIPVLVVAGSEDEMLPVGHHARALAGRFALGDYVELGYAAHFGFLGRCTSGALEILREENAEFLCHDPAASTRQAIHDRAVRYIAGFLDASFDRDY